MPQLTGKTVLITGAGHVLTVRCGQLPLTRQVWASAFSKAGTEMLLARGTYGQGYSISGIVFISSILVTVVYCVDIR